MGVLTRKDIREMRRNCIKVTSRQERELLKLWGHEPLEDGERYCYSEQDIYEQTRRYLSEHPDVDTAEEEDIKRRTLWLESLKKKEESQRSLRKRKHSSPPLRKGT
jgi:uncharacterized Zn finger protein